jgi:glucose-6-phosphate 1-dehydrogenase
VTAPLDQRFCNEAADPANIVIFGATGDLTKRKLMPALVRMLDCGLVHPESRIIGVVRDMSTDEWLQLVRDGLAE